MKLPAEEAELFFKLLWSLQFFVNQRLQLFPDIETLDDFKAAPIESRLQIRDAVCENAKLIDVFIQANLHQGDFDDKWLAGLSGFYTPVRCDDHHSSSAGRDDSAGQA
jgi:hypothetical protein